MMVVSLRVVLAVFVLSACGGASYHIRSGRTVMSEHNGGTIHVTPFVGPNGVWRARVQVWPRDVDPRTHGGIVLHFTETASSEGAIVPVATAFARHYIDNLMRSRAPDATPASQARAGETVMREHNGWAVRITPAATPDGRLWHADVQVWPPDRNPERHGGIQIDFTEVAADEKGIVESAIRSARRYIDASRARHQ
jgi:hypothetical protein